MKLHTLGHCMTHSLRYSNASSELFSYCPFRPGDISYTGVGTCEDYGSRILRQVVSINPEQLHLTLWSPTSMLVSWAAGGAMLGKGPRTPSWTSDAVHAIVEYGLTPDDLSMTSNGTSNNLVRIYPLHLMIEQFVCIHTSPACLLLA